MSAFAVALLCLAFFTLSANSQSCTHGSVRLVGGSGPWEGNVQLCYNGVWGWVCDNSFGTSDAYVVCRQLGYSTSYARSQCCSYYGWGNGTIWLDYLYCSGSESSLLSCSHAYSVGVTYCGYGEMAGVYCHNGGTCTNGDLRLSRYPYQYGRSEGRLDYCHNNQWGTVCNDYWGSYDTRVACYQLGYYRYSASYGWYGYGVGNIWLDNVHCNGYENSISACSKSCIGCHNCGHYEDIGIRCYGLDSSSCTNGDVRLWSAYNHPPNEGIIQICKSGTWYAMCDYYYYCYIGKLVCQQLGYAGALTLRSNAGYYYGYYYYNDHYRYYCYSYYTSFSQCFSNYYYSCGDYNDALGVVCAPSSSESQCTNGAVRLVQNNTNATSEGRVEYCYNGAWSPVCYLHSYTANIICKTLGFTQFTWGTIINDQRYGRSGISNNFNYLYCDSGDTVISDCTEYTSGGSCYISSSTCSTEYGLRCYNAGQCSDGEVRLANGTIVQEGRAEVCINGVWSGICQYGFNTIDAYVFCSQLGYDGGNPSVHYNAYFGENTGPIAWSYVYCKGWENSIHECTKSTYPSFTCYPQYSVGVTCKENCNDGDVRLLGGGFENEGTVEVCNSNIWGLVSDLGWTDGDARVVCNQLGYSGGIATPVHGSKYGKPNKTIHFKEVACAGHELNLAECSKTILSLSNGKLALPTTDVAGVDCIYDVPTLPPCVSKPSVTPGNCNNGTIRLATTTGSSTDNGRAEYCYNGMWTPFCKMDNKVASVICRQLGHTAYSWATIDASGSFGVTTNYSLFDNITCSGMETSISQCTLNESPNDCTPYCPFSNIGLRCFDTGTCKEGSIQLVDGIIENEGRVEICANGVWGSICDDGWDATDAHIVCTQQGHPDLEPVVYTNSYFGDGNYPIVYSNMGCGGWESNIASCQKDSYLDFTCTRDNIAGVLCGYDCSNGDVRLVGGYGAYEGTVEVCFENLWGLVSESGWTQEDGEVVCRQLGYPTEGTEVKYGSFYGTPEKTILVSSAQCTGAEEKLSDCTLSTLSLEQGKAALQTTQVAGVKCYTPDACVPPITTGISCTDTQLRLTGNNAQSGEGNLEYCYKGTWSPFCSLGANEATVACRQLGFTDADLVSVFADGRYGSISNVSQFQNFTCSTNRVEFALSECSLVQDCQSTCKYAIGIRCITRSDCQDGDVRLVNGSIAQEGRVEVCYNSIWGSLCGDQFDKSDGFVVCRELGLGDSEPTVYTNSYFGDGSGPILYSNLGCRGYESTIVNCAKSTYGSFSCSRSNIAGVTCQDACTDGDVRLVGGSVDSQGTVEVCYLNIWGLIADTNWDDKDAQVVCHQLGYDPSGSHAVTGSYYSKPNRTILLSGAACNGSESKLDSCDSEKVPPDSGRDLYAVVDVAGVQCVQSSTPPVTDLLTGNATGGFAAVGIIVVLLIVAIFIIISLVVFIIIRQRSSKSDINTSSRVAMSHVERQVENPASEVDSNSMYDNFDKEELIEAMGK